MIDVDIIIIIRRFLGLCFKVIAGIDQQEGMGMLDGVLGGVTSQVTQAIQIFAKLLGQRVCSIFLL